MDIQIEKGAVAFPKGFQAAGASAGLKPEGALDTALIYSDVPATAAIVTTTNQVKAAPVQWDNAVVRETPHKISAVIANSGNANACTGKQGYLDAQKEAQTVANALNEKYGQTIQKENVCVSSTGVIGVPLPVDQICGSVPALAKHLSKDGEDDASHAILTTDLVPKTAAVSVNIGGKTVHIGAMAKGSGMICPKMATMLSFVTTDAAIDAAVLQTMLEAITQDTYNMMSVDGDMSTNDTVLVLANGMAENAAITDMDSIDGKAFYKALYQVNETIAKSIVRDGEGATKFIEVTVKNMDTVANAKALAKAVTKSNLVKTAFFGEDANWGRVLSSAGAAGIAFDPATVDLTFENSVGTLKLLDQGKPVLFDEDLAAKMLAEKAVDVILDMNMGEAQATAWGCDLSHEYVRINGEYRT